MTDKRENNVFVAKCDRCQGSGRYKDTKCGICDGEGKGHPSTLSRKVRELDAFMNSLPEIK